MQINGSKIEDIKIAYIGGGSRGWAWGLMSDLAQAEDICGKVSLYDIDYEAAMHNEIIGNNIKNVEGCKSVWNYSAAKTLKEALTGADFVVISILPGTFNEMESDVHAPEKYGIFQSVGDTSGPGGIVRALRTIPMFEEIAKAVKEYSPEAWVINYTNPMTVCVKTLYKVFPEIKAFGCCHEVFGTQKLLAKALDEILGIKDVKRNDIKVNVLGINHFTWITEAKYKNIDLFPVYEEFVQKNMESEKSYKESDNWMNSYFSSMEHVKYDLFKRYGVIAAAGDRHLAEFCPGNWYLGSPEQASGWKFGLTPVRWRKENLQERLEKSRKLVSGELEFEIKETGEDGVNQIRAILGLCDLNANVNLPNSGQILNLPLGAVVETNAAFTSNSVKPIAAGNIPMNIYSLITRIVGEQECIVEAGLTRNLDLAFQAFVNDPLVRLPLNEAKELFDIMLNNTREYLKGYPTR